MELKNDFNVCLGKETDVFFQIMVNNCHCLINVSDNFVQILGRSNSKLFCITQCDKNGVSDYT